MLLTIVKFLYGFPLDDDVIDDDELIRKIRLSYGDKIHILFISIVLLYFILIAIYCISIKSLKY